MLERKIKAKVSLNQFDLDVELRYSFEKKCYFASLHDEAASKDLLCYRQVSPYLTSCISASIKTSIAFKGKDKTRSI